MTSQGQSGRSFWLRPRGLSIILTAIALGISIYLAWTELASASVLCIESGSFDCNLVQGSAYAEIFGIKVAYLGVFGNLGILLLLAFEDRVDFLQDTGPVLLFGVLLIGVIFSIWLIYVQAVRLNAYCQWCLAHEVVYFALFVLGALRLRDVFAIEDE